MKAAKGAFVLAAFGMGDAIGVEEENLFVTRGAKEGSIRIAGLGGVEVSGENKGATFAEGEEAFAQEFGGFKASLFASVIEVGVDEEQRFGIGGFFVAKFDPGHDPGEGGIPATAADFVGSFAEPEVIACEFVEAVFAPEEGGHFALVFAIVASCGKGGEIGKEFGEEVTLAGEGFLSTEQIGSESLDGFGEEVFAFVPVIFAIVGGAEANVKAHDLKGGR